MGVMNATAPYNLPLILLGLAIGLLGWVLYWAGIPLIGGVVGACAGGALGVVVSGFVKTAWSLPMFLGMGVVLGGVLGIIMMRAIQIYFFFICGASLGGTLTWHLLQQKAVHDMAANSPSWAALVAVAVGTLVGGFLMVRLRRFVIALISSIAGAIIVALGLPPQYQLMGIVISLVVFLVAQIGLVRRFVKKEDFDNRIGRKARAADEAPAK